MQKKRRKFREIIFQIYARRLICVKLGIPQINIPLNKFPVNVAGFNSLLGSGEFWRLQVKKNKGKYKKIAKSWLK